MDNIDEEIEQFLRGKLYGLLQLCTPEQKIRFDTKIYPDGVPGDHLKSAIALCQRTISANKGKT